MAGGDELREQLLDAIERAELARRLTGDLDRATRELDSAEWRLRRLTEMVGEADEDVQALERRGLPRLVRFARGSLDEDLRVERAAAEDARDRVGVARGELEDAQIEVGRLTERLAEFADAPVRLVSVLAEKQAWVLRTGDWRAPQLRGLARRTADLEGEVEALHDAQAVVRQVADDAGRLRDLAQDAVRRGVVAGPNPTMRAIQSGLDGCRDAVYDMWKQLEASPVRLPDLPMVRRLPKVDLTAVDLTVGYSFDAMPLVAIRDAAHDQVRRCVLIDRRLADAVTERGGQLDEIARVRQRLLTAADRTPVRGGTAADELPAPPWAQPDPVGEEPPRS